MKVGYARVSTKDQHVEAQRDALKRAGCEKVFIEKMTGTTFEREKLEEALNFVRSGDVLVVWKLDRLGRSLKHLIETIRGLEERNVSFVSITENIDTTPPGGKLCASRGKIHVIPKFTPVPPTRTERAKRP